MLAGFDIDSFLRDDWQQRPVVIRDAWPAWRNPLDGDTLAGLAGEALVESRLITRKSKTWALEHGPFPAARFAKLGKKPWTLLVQAVDHLVPDVAALLDPFRFVPDWRIDDVMVSYASYGGGVGPHFDQYDVFLVQGLGRRRWQVGGRCDATTALLPHDDLRLLAAFEPTAEWLLDPGDMLYVPPGVAHDGVAVGDDCMTYSIGFRAPARSDLIAHWSEHLLDTLTDDDRYGDAGLARQDHPGEIAADALARLHAMLTATMPDATAFARWFGQYATAPKTPDIDWAPAKPIRQKLLARRLAAGVPLRRNPASRFAFVRAADTVQLFVDGRTFDCPGPSGIVAEQICAHNPVVIDPASVTTAAAAVIAAVIDQGSLAFDDP